MSGTPLAFQRDYEFPRVIVWDALVDADLVSGWLAEAVIVPESGGEYNLRWLHKVGKPETFGRITLMTTLDRLDVDTHDVGRLTFQLEELQAGSRGTSTRLTLTVDTDVEPEFHPTIVADWLTNLDQLEALLRGHPVDWATWDRDRREDWSRHLEQGRSTE
jgi:uncharacterized protein YndB with AHSA1/START domain